MIVGASHQGGSLCHAYLCDLFQCVEIDNHPTLHVIDHLPEVSGGRVTGTLGNNECLLLLVTLFKSKQKDLVSLYYSINLHLQKQLHFPAL